MSHMLYIPLTAAPKGSTVLLDSTVDLVYLQPIEFTAATEIYYYKTIILISVIIAVLAAINMAILYRYILKIRLSQLAMLRICCCSKGRAIVSYLHECLIINAPLFALTHLVYHKLIMPRLSGLFPNMAGAYSFKLYAAVFGIYQTATQKLCDILYLRCKVENVRAAKFEEQHNNLLYSCGDIRACAYNRQTDILKRNSYNILGMAFRCMRYGNSFVPRTFDDNAAGCNRRKRAERGT